MDRLSGWVADILFFLVFITVTENLLPGRKYHSYIRLCAGFGTNARRIASGG